MDAVRANQVLAAQFLLDNYKVDPSDRDILGRTALHHGAQAGAVATVRMLLTLGVDVSCRGSVNDLTPLHYAAKEGQSEVAKCLLEHGASPQAVDSRGRTPLDIATAARHTSCAKLLV
jgi:ankyrin repeat protein